MADEEENEKVPEPKEDVSRWEDEGGAVPPPQEEDEEKSSVNDW